MRTAAATEPMMNSSSPAAEEGRRRVYVMLDAADLECGMAVRWCERALHVYREGGDIMEARRLLRGALICGMHPPTIYRAWIAMEENHHHACGADAATTVIRMLFEEWRSRCGVVGCLPDNGGYWCRYVAFELVHGGSGGERVRAVAEAAVAACPRDAAVYAVYAKAELRLGNKDRESAVLGRARQVFASHEDAGVWERLMEEVKTYKKSLRQRRLIMCSGFLPFGGGGGRWSRQTTGSGLQAAQRSMTYRTSLCHWLVVISYV